ncbi:hypothetical protein C7437_102378 [Psychrobacillus insolitus]|uniref:Uncharacterized protein n=1 Tax=Psychrobacillus insolitus TaxID=1461 RepID=A0A2W7MID5_9BACI|nr:hypothetical protein [Psychrobacillus insolitus]PZX05911.1 hypothetical protein C7437_102378 [Psychrobacillus insolitus]
MDQISATLYREQSFFSWPDFLYLTTIVNEEGVPPNVITEDGRELAKAHQDEILLNYHQFNKMTALENVPETKEFTAILSDSIADNLQTQKIELVN